METINGTESFSLWELVTEGGYLMIPLALLLIVSIYIFIERCIVINRAGKQDKSFIQGIRNCVHSDDLAGAEALCKKADTPAARMILKGITRIGRPVSDVLSAIENTGNIEMAKLGKGFNWLSTTAAGAPMLGFLGTVIGMIEAFMALADAGQGANITVLSSGIYQALITTVAGLVVGILALFAYNYLVGRVNRVMTGMEAQTMEFMDLLNEPVM